MPEQPVHIEIIDERLRRIEAKLDEVTSDHERRLRAVEKWVYAIPPTLLIAIAAIVAAIIEGGNTP